MKNYKIYLEKKKFTLKRVKRSIGIVQNYKSWLEENSLEIEDMEYRDILNYIGFLQKHNFKKVVINEYLVNIGHYYNYLEIENPTIGVRLLGIEEERQILFGFEELDKIYENYKPSEKGIYKQIDKLLLGLTIYQALDTKGIFQIKIEDINLEKGKILIPSTGKYRQERILKLESHQIIPFNHYINNVRLKYNNKLFTRACEYEETLKTYLYILLKRLRIQSKEINIEVQNLTQLRQSRYSIWLKQYGIRQTQYMGGFKNPKSLLRYQEQNIEDLKSDIEKYHPLK
ncbi:MAG: hypothetical protein ACFFD1_02580 [Candidatus Thorarchaeota archaeon]